MLMPAMLGNMLFRYATLLGVAAKSGLKPVCSRHTGLAVVCV